MNGQIHKIGERWGTFTIIDIEKKQNGCSLYVLNCDCGALTKKIGCHLRLNGKCQFCKCFARLKEKNHKTSFLKYLGRNTYECLCDCGNKFTGRPRSKSCGCHIEEEIISGAKKMEGIKFGAIKILKFKELRFNIKKNARASYYTAKCDCGKIFELKRNRLFRSKTCGCHIVNNYSKAEHHYNSKYTDQEIAILKELYISGSYSKLEICGIFNLRMDALTKILKNKSWASIKYNKKTFEDSRVKKELFKKCKHVEIGKKYGSWLVLEKVQSKKGHSYYKCLCECNKEFNVSGSSLCSGTTRKCHNCNVTKYNVNKKYNYSDCIGEKIGCRTILSYFIENKQHKGLARCECGFEDTIILRYIIKNPPKFCKKCYPRSFRKGILC
jgi:hypothetical protein